MGLIFSWIPTSLSGYFSLDTLDWRLPSEVNAPRTRANMANAYPPLTLGLVALTLSLGCGQASKHPPGKDTRESFGDGRFQIVELAGGPDRLALVDLDLPQKVLVNDLYDWRTRGETVYAVDQNGRFVELNFRNGNVSRYDSLAGLPENTRAKFLRLAKPPE